MRYRAFDAMWFEDDYLSGIDVLFSLPSNDIWKKFDLQDEPLTDLFPTKDLDQFVEFDLDDALSPRLSESGSEIRHHDCMWAGLCMSKEHKTDNSRTSKCGGVSAKPVPKPCNNNIKPPTPGAPGRSLLLNSRVPTLKYPALPTIRPDSPPSSDDDDHPRYRTETSLFGSNRTLNLINDSDGEGDEDSDLCDYFEESDSYVSPAVVSRPPPQARTPVFANEFDHSYHKGKAAHILRTDHLGVQTPSDSEEEIDVVSISDKQNISVTRCSSTVLPTNPSILDRQKLQRTVASAINEKQELSQRTGIKTRLPLRLPHHTEQPPMKKRQATKDGRSRGVKRARMHHYKSMSPGSSPNKRRHGSGQSSDSDTECSEKRSLHNNMERQRRVDLRNAFDDLRVQVPKVSGKERAAKVVILQEAAVYCDHLTADSKAMTKQVSELRKQQERLRSRLSQLRRSLAANR